MYILFAYANYGETVFDPVALASELCSPLLRIHDEALLSLLYSSQADQFIDEFLSIPASEIPLVLKPRRLRRLHRAVAAVCRRMLLYKLPNIRIMSI